MVDKYIELVLNYHIRNVWLKNVNKRKSQLSVGRDATDNKSSQNTNKQSDFQRTSFKSSAMLEPNWEMLTPKEFEYFTDVLVQAKGFCNVSMTAHVGDEGLDVVGYIPTSETIPQLSRKCVFQSKRQKRISRPEILEELSRFSTQDIDTWVLVTTWSPPTAFRSWLKAQSKSNFCHFYVDALWREDINNCLLEHADYFLNRLPPIIIDKLGLSGYLKHSSSNLETVIEKCGQFTQDQIQRFAHGKYIRGLYVDREIESYLYNFHTTEAKLAKRLKNQILADITNVRELFSDADKDAHSIITTFSDLNIKKLELTRVLSDYAHSVRGEIKDKIIGLFSAILRTLDAAYFSANSLSDTKLYAQQGSQQTLTTAFNESLQNVRDLIERSSSNEAIGQFKIRFTDLLTVVGKLKETRSARTWLPVEQTIERLQGFLNFRLESAAIRLRDSYNLLETSLRPCVVLVDRAGGGKTNLLCQFSSQIAVHMPTILLFAKDNYQGQNSLIEGVQRILREAGLSADNPIEDLDSLTNDSGLFLNVLIDGINETRSIQDLNGAICAFLVWANGHRIRVTLTCRDIYWHFFQYDLWSHFVFEMKQNELYQFSPSEYKRAIPLYLSYYKIKADLASAAKEACRHPLLLRFFCESYYDPKGSWVNLGLISDIRLKELFDTYYDRKTEQIRQFLGHHNADAASRFLINIVKEMYVQQSATLLTSHIEQATGETDTSTQDSIYLRFLDEDVIIEEEPTADIDLRRVHFVYEEFMEYVLSKYFMSIYRKNNNILQITNKLISDSLTWIHSYGVVLYIALTLYNSQDNHERKDGFHLIRSLVSREAPWNRTFWSVVGRLPLSALTPKLFDLFPLALLNTSEVSHVRLAPAAMSRFNQISGAQIAAIILWSGFVPSVLKWRDVYSFDKMPTSQLKRVGDRLAKQMKTGLFPITTRIGTNNLLNLSIPYLSSDMRGRLRKARTTWGQPGQDDLKGIMYIIRGEFPQEEPYLLNGVFLSDTEVAKFCADRIRFLKIARKQIAYLCNRIAKEERRVDVQKILLDSANRLEQIIPKTRTPEPFDDSFLPPFNLLPYLDEGTDEDAEMIRFMRRGMDREDRTEILMAEDDLVYYPSE